MSSTTSNFNISAECSPKRLPLSNSSSRSNLQSQESCSTKTGSVSQTIPESSNAGASRRHGRFLVQPLTETGLATTPSNVRTSSPATKPVMIPGKLQSSPPVSAVLSERRPSRIIGRFEVCELFDDASKTGGNPVSLKAVDAVHKELSQGGETCATTPVRDQEMGA